MTPAASSEPMPTISRRKTIINDHCEYEHFSACCLLLTTHQDEDDWKSTTVRSLWLKAVSAQTPWDWLTLILTRGGKHPSWVLCVS